MSVKQKKIILIGNFSVGKTSLIRRYVDNSFDDKYISTIGVKISKKNISIEDEEMMLLIWDIEGALDKVRRVNKTYIKGAHAAIIVTDITSEEIEETITIHLNDLYDVTGEIPVLIAFNKIDKNENFQMDIGSLQSKYPSLLGSYFTSAKNDLNVNTLFRHLSSELISCK